MFVKQNGKIIIASTDMNFISQEFELLSIFIEEIKRKKKFFFKLFYFYFLFLKLINNNLIFKFNKFFKNNNSRENGKK